MDAKTAFVIASYCSDCNQLVKNVEDIHLLLKAIKEEERTFENIATFLNFVDKNKNDCKLSKEKELDKIDIVSKDEIGFMNARNAFLIAFYCSDNYQLVKNIKLILKVIIKEERTFEKIMTVLNDFKNKNDCKLSPEKELDKIDIDSKDEIGFMNARNAFMIAFNCSDCYQLEKNIKLIMKVIIKEERTFDNIVTVLNDFVDKNENDCKTFLNFEKIQEICSLCDDISDKENDN